VQARVPYQLTSRFDELHRRLVNTGHQLYSATIAGTGTGPDGQGILPSPTRVSAPLPGV